MKKICSFITARSGYDMEVNELSNLLKERKLI